MHLGHPFQWKNTFPWHLGPAAKVRILRFKIFRHSGMILVFKTTFEVFTRVGPDNSLVRVVDTLDEGIPYDLVIVTFLAQQRSGLKTFLQGARGFEAWGEPAAHSFI
jgi:hypothetical protein